MMIKITNSVTIHVEVNPTLLKICDVEWLSIFFVFNKN